MEIEKAGTSEFTSRRQRQRNVRLVLLDYGQMSKVSLSPYQIVHVVNYLPVITQFLTLLDLRISAYDLVPSRFGFLTGFEYIDSEQLYEKVRLLT